MEEQKFVNEENASVVESFSPAELKNMRLTRFANIFYRMFTTSVVTAIVVLCLCVLFPAVSAIAYVAIFFLGVFAILVLIACSVGTILLQENNIVSKIWGFIGNTTNSMDKTMVITKFLFSSIPYILFVGLALSVLSIVFLSLSRQSGRIKAIITTCILTFLIVVGIVLYFVLGGTLWQN